ncbi:hypothetical protein [Nocardioides sp. InS609-2]|uniref:hypothetical protein n=1 Tax=Nocardioides sp. InS609-2 TaxID=2760705 RepID=UPI0020BFA958|nr:hypothetical protein [Nocardioides sp. InS609-2]
MTEWTRDGSVWAVIGAFVLLVALAALALVRVRAASRRDLASARAEAADLRHRLDELERTVSGSGGAAIESVVVSTPLDRQEPIEGRLFADLVLRESVVKAASWAHGVRRALSPENRNRIRFEMGREVKRARKSRRAEIQEALRAHRARERAAGTEADQGSEDAA